MRHFLTALTCSFLLTSAGCGDLFDVENPGSVLGEDLQNPEMLPALLDLPEVAGIEYHATYLFRAGMIGDDLMEPLSNSWAIRADEGEFQLQPNSQLEGLYDLLGSATWILREARDRIEALVPNPESHEAVARAYYWDGHLQATRADAFEEITFDGGSPHSPVEVYEMALELLDHAALVAAAAGETDYVAAAHGTMARVERSLFFERDDEVHLVRAAEHAEQALTLQPDFRLDARYFNSGGTNGLYGSMGPQSLPTFGVGEVFGDGWIDPVTGEVDPRIESAVTPPLADLARGTSYKQTKYPAPDSPIPVSRWQEAVLILAEYHLELGSLTDAVAEINRVREAAGLPDFEGDNPDEVRAQIIYERQTEFFLEGRNWQDHRYYGTFPVRWNDTARGLGVDRRIPMSERERVARSLE